jgi:hypothetical protein
MCIEPQSNATAAEQYTRAAAQGHGVSQRELYRVGKGVPQSYEKAADKLHEGSADAAPS